MVHYNNALIEELTQKHNFMLYECFYLFSNDTLHYNDGLMAINNAKIQILWYFGLGLHCIYFINESNDPSVEIPRSPTCRSQWVCPIPIYDVFISSLFWYLRVWNNILFHVVDWIRRTFCGLCHQVWHDVLLWQSSKIFKWMIKLGTF